MESDQIMPFALRAIAILLLPATTLLLLEAKAEPPRTPRFPALEKHALSARKADEADFKTLADFLVSKAKGDKEKAWCIYRWVTDRISYDVDSLLKKDLKLEKNTPEAVLNNRLCVCEGYSRIYKKLCEEAGLEVVQITGHARDGNKDKSGVPLHNTHAWNAVKLDGKWELIDPTFGSGSIEKEQFRKNFEPMFFLVPPDQMRFSHYPEDSKWQLIEKTISKDEFDRLPLVRASMFRMGISPSNINKSIKAKGFDGFPEVFDVPGVKLKVVDAPLQSRLKTGQQVRVIIESGDISKMLIVANDKPLVTSPRQGAGFVANFRAPPGSIVVAVQKPNSGNEYAYVLKYKVE
ncbi:MAG: hypothetical protein RIR17_9 [Planctomycetota bacterium]|jgi:hypothetical protein